jgi:hypothetical protein
MDGDRASAVREEAWTVLNDFARSPNADENDLSVLADGLKGHPKKELDVLQQLLDRLGNDLRNPALTDVQRAAIAEHQAAQEADIGDVMMDPTVNQPAQAEEQYRAAFDYWKTIHGAAGTIDQLGSDVARAALAAKHWDAAATFASGIIKDFGAHSPVAGDVSREFNIAAQNLENSSDPGAYADFTALLAAVNKMDPPLAGDYRDELTNMQAVMRQKHAGENPPTTLPAQ